MSRSLRLSRFLRAGLKIENQFHALSRRPNAVLQKLDISSTNFARSATCDRRKYSTEAQRFEKQKVVAASAAGAVRSDDKVDISERVESGTLMSELRELDDQVRRIGRVDLSQIRSLLRRCKNGMASEEAVMLIRCCGNLLVKETPEERSKLLEEVFTKVESCCDATTINMINAFLSMKLENHCNFSPTEQLEAIKKNGIEPNKTTFTIMMAQFCKMGDVDGAALILEHMRLSDWPVGLPIMHLLIEGYMKKGDMSEVDKLISQMSQRDLSPTAETYMVLMKGHAEKGDIEAIKQVMTTVTGKGIRIGLSNTYEVIMSLSQSGHADKVREALDVFISSHMRNSEARETRGRSSGGHRRFDYQDSTNVIYRLVTAGHQEEALELLKRITSSGIIYENVVSNLASKAIVLEMIKKGRDFSQVMEMRDKLMQERFLDEETEFIVFQVLHHSDIGYAVEFLTKLSKEVNVNILPHFTLPLFYRAKAKKSKEDIYKVTELLLLDSSDYVSRVSCIIGHSFNALKELGQTTEEILKEYKAMGMSSEIRHTIEIVELTRQGEFAKVCRLIEGGHHIFMRFIDQYFGEGIKKSMKLNEFFELVRTLQNKLHTKLKINGVLLSKTMKMFEGKQSNEMIKFIEDWVNSEIKFGGNHPFEQLAKKCGVEKELIEKLMALKASRDTLVEFESPLMKDINLDEVKNLKGQEHQRRRREKVERKIENALTQEAQDLLRKRQIKDFKNLVHNLSEKGDVETLADMNGKLRLPLEVRNFFERSIFIAHIHKGQAKEYMEANREVIKTISINVLSKLVELDPDVFVKVEEMMLVPVQEMKISPCVALYNHYLKVGDDAKISKLFETHPQLKDKIFLRNICRHAMLNGNEGMLRKVIDLHSSPEMPMKVAPAYNNLVLLKCQSKDAQAALSLYNEALSSGIVFDNFSIRTLQSLQSLLRGSNLPLPWKEGEVEKKAEKSTRGKDRQTGSDSESD